MKSAIAHERFIISINHDETLRLMDGQTIGDRNSPFYPEAKTEVRPLSDLDPFYEPVRELGSVAFAENLRKYRYIVQMFSDMDIVVYVPREVPTFWAIASEDIERDNVQIMVAEAEAQGYRDALPLGGVQIRFDGMIPN